MSDTPNEQRRAFLMKALSSVALTAVPLAATSQKKNNFFELRAAPTPYKLMGGDYPASSLWLYNRSTPGPEMRVSQGETVRVRFVNELEEPSSIHWHGIRIDNSMDGVSGLTQRPVQPGEHFDYVFQVPDSGTFWYHAHNKSWQQVARGLYGALIIDEPTPLVDRDHDITLVIDDWRLDSAGKFDRESMGSLRDWSHRGRLGNWLTVNGISQPNYTLHFKDTYRIRLINTCNARILQIRLPEVDTQVIAYDGIQFDKPRTGGNKVISLLPAQRADILFTLEENTVDRQLRTGSFAVQEISGSESVDITSFKIASARPISNQLLPLQPPNQLAKPDLKNAREVSLKMHGGAMGRLDGMTYQGKPLTRTDIRATGQLWAFNGVANLAKRPLFSAHQGETVVINAANDTGWSHGIHLHGHHFQVLEINGDRPEFIEWRDTFAIYRNQKVKIAFVADNPGKWLLHCHMLEHAAAGMNTWFEVA